MEYTICAGRKQDAGTPERCEGKGADFRERALLKMFAKHRELNFA
jgi:hypothetical protein